MGRNTRQIEYLKERVQQLENRLDHMPWVGTQVLATRVMGYWDEPLPISVVGTVTAVTHLGYYVQERNEPHRTYHCRDVIKLDGIADRICKEQPDAEEA